MKLLKAEQVAKILQVPKARVYDLARQRKIPSVRLGRQIRFSEDELRAWIVGGGVSPSSEEASGPVVSNAGDAFTPGR